MTDSKSGTTKSSPDSTASEIVESMPTLGSQTKLYSVSEWGWQRDIANLRHDDVRDAHYESQVDDLEIRAADKVRRSVAVLLEELSEARGLGWNDIASLVGVSVSAIRKWRSGGPASPDSRLELARLAAFLDVLSEFAIDDPGSWMEIALPLPPGYSVRPVDLYRDKHLNALLDIASRRRQAHEVLTDIDPDWRGRRSDFEVVDGPDGDKLIQTRRD
jgi:transcriptional regulator with XRE-family HTH domain